METDMSITRTWLSGPRQERRAAARVRTFEEHGIVGARVRAGRDATVLDVSDDGILIDTPHRLLPGATIELQLAGTERRATVRGHVVRSTVASLRNGVRYRGAVLFERPLGSLLDVDGYSIPALPAGPPRDGREDATPLAL
jgi:hypothetical protein